MTAPTPAPEFVVVPREPTEEMIEAGAAEVALSHKRYGTWRDRAVVIYRAMIAAAPPRPLPTVEEVARRINPQAWEFADRHRPNPIMAAEVAHETRRSRVTANDILSLIRGEG